MCANCVYVCTNYAGTATCHLYLYTYKINKLYIRFLSFTGGGGETGSLMVLDNLKIYTDVSHEHAPVSSGLKELRPGR